MRLASPRSGRVGIAMRGTAAKDIYEETPAEPKHTVKVLHLDPATRLTTDGLRRHLQERVDVLPVLRRVVRGPGLAHAWWVELDHVDVADHLEVLELPAGPRARSEAVAAELARSIPRDRPLWRIVLLDAPDGQSLILSASHALLDGVVAARVLEALFGPEVRSWPSEARPLPPPSVELAGLLVEAPQLVARAARAGIRRRREGLSRDITPPFSGASAPWNAHLITPERDYAEAAVPLATFQATARAGGATFTDLVVAVVGGAIRDFAPEAGAGQELLAVVPSSVQGPDDSPTEVNVLTFYFVGVGAQVADHRERLARVGSALRAAKAHRSVDPRLFADSWDLWPVMAALQRSSSWVARRWFDRPPQSLSVSTVRGPQVALSVAGVPVRTVVSAGVVREELGLSVTVWSVGDQVTFGVVTRPALVRAERVTAALGVACAEYADVFGVELSRAEAP